MTLAPATDSPPDWSVPTLDLCCPLCEYNLRGLTEPRCPECGFAFNWAELMQGQREGHKYLFEHHPKRNIWSFWKTYWSDCYAAKFWGDVNPAQPVRLRRLIMFWLLSAAPILLVVVGSFASNTHAATIMAILKRRVPPGEFINYPLPSRSSPSFSSMEWVRAEWGVTSNSPWMIGSMEALAWPWLTLLLLLVFFQSMRRAKIKKRHLLRVIVYGCDYYLVLIPVILLGKAFRDPATSVMVIALVCGTLVTFRLYHAYARYLRFHMPLVTVITSQILVLLLAVILYLQTCRVWWI